MQEQKETLEDVFKRMRETLVDKRDLQKLNEYARDCEELRRKVNRISTFKDVRIRQKKMEQRYTRRII